MSGGRRGWLRLLIFCHATALAASPAAAATFPLLWDAPPEPVASYRVYRATAPAGPYTLLKTVTAPATRVEVPLDQTRCYRVRAVDNLGQASDMSGRLCITITTEAGE